MEKFRAYRIHGEGGKTVARFEELTLDDLDPGEVVVRVRFSGVSGCTAMTTRRKIRERMGTDLRPRHLETIARTVAFDDLPALFEGCIRGEARGRVVVKVS